MLIKIVTLQDKKRKTEFTIQEHWAKKAGYHKDLRIKDDKDKWRSWAMRKGGLPRLEGVKVQAFPTPYHSELWSHFTGRIPEDVSKKMLGFTPYPEQKIYGRGYQQVYDKGKAWIVKDTPNILSIMLKGKKVKGLYHLIRTGKKKDNWIATKGSMEYFKKHGVEEPKWLKIKGKSLLNLGEST